MKDEVLSLLIGQRASLYLCGSASMGAQVKRVLDRCSEEFECWDSPENLCERLKIEKRLLEDTWDT